MQVFNQSQMVFVDMTGTANFSGRVRMQRVIDTEQSSEVELLFVHFDAGARTRPHVHPVDQVLHILEGRGIVATAQETRYVDAGSVVLAPAGEWHWHGATPDSAMTHVSIKQPGETNWDVEEGNWATNYDSGEQNDAE